MFSSFTKRKSSKDQKPDKKYSITALMQASALNPDVHETILQPAGNGAPANGAANGKTPTDATDGAPGPLLGTVLHPIPPKPPVGSRTPFEEWRHFRGGRPPGPMEPPRRISAPAHSPSMQHLRGKTPEPDYDTASIASTSSRSSYGRGTHLESSHEELRRQVGPGSYYTGSGHRSVSAMGIPRFQAQRPRTASLLSASPRLEHPFRAPSSDSFFGKHGAHLASAESQLWYQSYSHEAFPHEANFGDEASYKTGVHNYDGRINHIRGKTGERRTRSAFDRRVEMPRLMAKRGE